MVFVRLLLTGLVATLLMEAAATVPQLVVSENGRYLQTREGAPFFWLGDTGWLLFQKLNRQETLRYLDDRQRKGFNVIQCMILHDVRNRNFVAAAALVDGEPGRPNITPGNDLNKAGEYDYWDHIDWVADQAAQRGIYLAMVPAWGSIARSGKLNDQNVEAYGRFLANRYSAKPNVIWLNGGDTQGDKNTEVWKALGRTLRQLDPKHLITFHPFGRTQSSTWFHNEPWLDFNMFQSGHRRYDQDDTPKAKGEDNWRYAQEDYAKTPVKPTLDGEPSYEGIPQGLHDWKEPLWTDKDVRRYAYWSVFAGSFGHTYGHAAIMSMRKPEENKAGQVRKTWSEALDDPGASQLQHLKNLMLSRPYFERVPDQSLVVGENGIRYDYVVATRGRGYAFLYTHTGRPIQVDLTLVSNDRVRAWWFDPRTGEVKPIGTSPATLSPTFRPPSAGSDWVLVLDDAAAKFGAPGKPTTPGKPIE